MLTSTSIHTSTACHLSCSQCAATYDLYQLHTYSLCCQKPLLTQYRYYESLSKDALLGRESTMWRYHELLPVLEAKNRVSLGEGMTPIIKLEATEKKYGFSQLWLKDEGLNPTGSFKARGLSMAVSKAKELGVTSCVIPTAGNAGGAMSAYCAAAGIKATVIMPSHTPKAFQDECRLFGADLILIDGLIDKCGEAAGTISHETGAFNMSTLKEPYRLEGKKTMGFEIAEQMNWQLPDVIVYPTGGGTGLIGIWKAFHEMITMKWITGKPLSRMVVVQSTNCAPMVDYIHGNQQYAPYGESRANGLAVPKAFGQDLIKKVVNESKGEAVAVSESDILKAAKELSILEGISMAPEGGATWAGLQQLVDNGHVSRDEKILLINTGSASKYMENLIP